jgi:hypothetical protein
MLRFWLYLLLDLSNLEKLRVRVSNFEYVQIHFAILRPSVAYKATIGRPAKAFTA